MPRSDQVPDALLSAAARCGAARAALAAGPCPDADLLAGFAEGRLPAGPTATVEAHASACAPCRKVLVALGTAPGTAEPAAEGRQPRWLLGLAALLLAAVGAGWLLLREGPGHDTATPASRLEQALAALRTQDPAAFAGLRVLVDADGVPAEAQESPEQRGGLRVHAPRGTVLANQALHYTFDLPPGAQHAALRVRDERGSLVLDVPEASSGFEHPSGAPALAPGARYAVEVTARGAVGVGVGRAAFRVADARLEARWNAVERAIRERAEPSLRSLLRAQAAWQLDLRLLALDAAREAEAATGASGAPDPAARRTRETIELRFDAGPVREPGR